MTRAEILNCLTDRPCDSCKFHESGRCERWDCVLEEEPDDAEESEDAISRQATLDAFGLSEKTRKYGGDHSGYDTMMLYEIQDVIEVLPSVTPKQKMGHWIYYQKNIWIYAQCSECGTVHDTKTNYCPNCGAKMEESENG